MSIFFLQNGIDFDKIRLHGNDSEEEAWQNDDQTSPLEQEKTYETEI